MLCEGPDNGLSRMRDSLYIYCRSRNVCLVFTSKSTNAELFSPIHLFSFLFFPYFPFSALELKDSVSLFFLGRRSTLTGQVRPGRRGLSTWADHRTGIDYTAFAIMAIRFVMVRREDIGDNACFALPN